LFRSGTARGTRGVAGPVLSRRRGARAPGMTCAPPKDTVATSQPERITEYLLRDHQRLRALLERARAADPLDEEAFAAFRAGLLRHIAIEEKLLWPAARRARGDRPLEQARALRIEHAALGSLLVPTPDAALCDEIRSLLGAHDAREEGEGGVYT